MKILETDRLFIRQLRPDDLDEFWAVCGDPEVMRHVGDGRPLTREQTQAWIEKSQENYRKYGFGCMAVVAREGGRLVGYCGLVSPTGDGAAELVYAFRKQCRGKGLASEAAGAMLEFGLRRCGLKRIVATIDPDNRASVRVACKLGMRYRERRLDEHGLPEVVYAIEDCDLPRREA